MSLEIPPLRERPGDVRLLAEKLLGPDWSIEPDALQALETYDWPGNVRQLINTIDRAKILADDQVVRLDDLPAVLVKAIQLKPLVVDSNNERLDAIERAHVLEVFERSHGNKARAARALGISRRSLYRLVEKYGIQDGTPTVNPVSEV